jgi:Flp pilus assembly protein TadG
MALKSIFSNRRGSAAVFAAIALPSMVGGVGLAVDYGVWVADRQAVQRAADAGALGAIYAMQEGVSDQATLQSIAQAEARMNAQTAEVTLTLPQPGQRTVSVTATSQAPLIFAGRVLPNGVTVRAQSTATISGSSLCIIALQANPNTRFGVRLGNNGAIAAPACAVHSNATDVNGSHWVEEGSIYVRNGTIAASRVTAVGSVTASTNGTSIINPAGEPNQPAMADPLAGLPTPTFSGTCLNGNFTAWQAGTINIAPGRYCSGIQIANGNTAQFQPGTYLVEGDFSVQGGARVLDSAGVTFIQRNGQFNFGNGSSVALTAPTTGTYAGLLYWQIMTNNSCNGNPNFNQFTGGVTYTLTGTIYLPNCSLLLHNNAQVVTSAGGFIAVAARTIEIQGSARLQVTDFVPYGVASSLASSGRPRLRSQL